MTKNITLVRGDDTNFFNQILLIISFKTVLNLDGYKLRLTIENPTNIIKHYEVQQNTVEINFGKIDSSTFSIGEHRANIRLIDTLGRVKTMYTFNIYVQDEFEANIPEVNEYELEINLDTEGISKYKNYNELYNKPSINDIELVGNKTLDELGIQPSGNYSTYEYVDGRLNSVNTELENINTEINNTNAILITKANISYVEEELDLKANKIELNTKANISDIPTKVSQLVNDEGYLTEHQDISNKADVDYVEELLDRKSNKTDVYTKVEVNSFVDDINDNLATKQDKGDYLTHETDPIYSADKPNIALKSDIPDTSNLASKDDIPDLTDYVKNTDYASSNKAGLIRTTPTYGLNVSESTGVMYSVSIPLGQYETVSTAHFISKGTLENIKDDYVKRGVTENALELTEDEKASAKQWLGFATPTEIMQAIASIPQFSISIVDALPETGEKMTLYLVSKGGESPDVYDEYIWIEETSTFEFLGTTAVDLTDYVKNTDYADSNTGGVLKIASQYSAVVSSSGYLTGSTITLDNYDTANVRAFVSKGTLDNVLTQYSKTVLTTEADYEALETKDSNTLYLIEEE